MLYVSIQVKGSGKQALVDAIDSVAASIERNELERVAEAPDKSGGYNYKTFDVPPYIWGEFDTVTQKKAFLDEVENLNISNQNLTKSNEELKSAIVELNRNNPLKKPLEDETKKVADLRAELEGKKKELLQAQAEINRLKLFLEAASADTSVKEVIDTISPDTVAEDDEDYLRESFRPTGKKLAATKHNLY